MVFAITCKRSRLPLIIRSPIEANWIARFELEIRTGGFIDAYAFQISTDYGHTLKNPPLCTRLQTSGPYDTICVYWKCYGQ